MGKASPGIDDAGALKGSVLQGIEMFWATGLGVTAVLLACATVGLLLYGISAFIIGLVVRLMGLWLPKSRGFEGCASTRFAPRTGKA